MYRKASLLLVMVLAADSTFPIGLGHGPAVAPVHTKLPQLESVLNFPRCQRGDPAFGECLASAVQKVLPLLASGIPALSFPPFDPWYVGSLDLQCPRGNSTICLLLSNVVAHGLGNARVLKITPDLKNFRMTITVEVTILTFESEYKTDAVINGKPLLSQGRCNITFVKTQGTLTLTGKTVVRQGRTYLHFNNSPFDIPYAKNVTFSFVQMDAEPKRNADLNKLFNDNSMLIFQEIKRPWKQQFATRYNDLANIIFDEVPIDVIFLGCKQASYRRRYVGPSTN